MIYRDLNLLILGYLITNGYPSAAKRFAAEACIRTTCEDACIEERVAIRLSILEGDIPAAILCINQLSANVSLLTSRKIPPHPHQQRLYLIMHHSERFQRLVESNYHFSPQYELITGTLRSIKSLDVPVPR